MSASAYYQRWRSQYACQRVGRPSARDLPPPPHSWTCRFSRAGGGDWGLGGFLPSVAALLECMPADRVVSVGDIVLFCAPTV